MISEGASTTPGVSASATSPLIVEGGVSSASARGKKRSTVWDDFEEVMVNGVLKVRCIHCKTLYTKNPKGTTTHLHRHRQSCSKRPRIPFPDQQLLSFTKTEGEDSQDILTTHKFDKEKLKEWYARLVIVEEQPFRMVESEAFMEFSKFLNPQVEKVSRITVKRECMKMYANEKMKMKAILASVSRISLTSNLWTSSNQRKGYISLTAHYVDKDWKLCKSILNFRHFPPHSDLVISDCIYSCLQEWGIEKKISSITLDNASANDSVISFLRNQFKATGNLFFEGKIFQVRCCADMINLIVQEGLKIIDPTIENIRESIKYIRGSHSRLSIWNDIIQHLNVTSHKTLKLDVCTRWNSTFEMLDSAMKLELAFPEYATRDKIYSWLPNEDDWRKVQEVHKFLKVFYDCSKIFSEIKYPTANLFFLSLWKIKEAIKKSVNEGPNFLQLMAIDMEMKFDKYWDECYLLMALAAVLDPRCKMSMVKFVFMKIYSVERALTETSKVRDAFEELYTSYVSTLPTSSAEEVKAPDVSTSDDNFLSEFMSFLAQETENQTKESELDLYLKEPILRRANLDFDVLGWWKMRVIESQYPTLSVMARDILSIPISTVTSEFAFSTGSRVLSKHRSSLSQKTVEALICTQDWLRPIWGSNSFDIEDEEEEEIEFQDEAAPTTTGKFLW